MELDQLIMDTISVTSVYCLYLMQKSTIFHTRTCFNLWGVVWLFHDNCLNGKMMLNVSFFSEAFLHLPENLLVKCVTN